MKVDCSAGAAKAPEDKYGAPALGSAATEAALHAALGAATTEAALHTATHPHGAVFHAARAAHLAQLGARQLDGNAGGGRFGIEGIWRDAVPEHEHDAGEGLVWRVDHRGEESLVEESKLGRHVRMSQENHAAAASQIASYASKLGARGTFARFAHAAAAALRVRDGKSEKHVLDIHTGANVDVEGAHAVDDKSGLPTHVVMMERAFADFAGSRMDKEEKDGGAFTAALLQDLAAEELRSPQSRSDGHRAALLGAPAAEIARHHAALPRGSAAAAVTTVCAPRVAATAPLRAFAAAVCARAAELAAESVPFDSLRAAGVSPGPAMAVAKACATSEGKRAHAKPGTVAAGWRVGTVSDAIAALVGVEPKSVAPALARFYAADAEVARRAVHAVASALADPCDAAAATAAIVCPLASAAAAAGAAGSTSAQVTARANANAVERCALAASTLATATCGVSRVDAHAAHRYAACATTSVASLPCSETCTAALSALPVHCGAIVPRADHGFAPGAQHGAACEAALHAAQAGCDAAADGACADLLEAAPPSLLRHVAAKHADGHIQYLHFAEQSARGVMPSSMCRHGTVHHVDLRGNNLMGSVPDCAWSGGQALGNGNLYLSRNLLSGTIGKLGAGHRNVHVNHNKLAGDLGAALTDAHSLRTLQAGRNRFTGTLDALKGKESVRHVHVEGNRLSDTVDSPVAAVLASLPELQSYEISNNRFASHAAAAALGSSGSAAERVDHVALGAAQVAGLSRSVHVVTHLRVPISHICPMCGDAGQEANCGAVPQCRKHPDVLANVPEDLRGSMSELMPKIAPEIVNHGDAVDVVETMQCSLKHEAERFMARGNVPGKITAVRVERTVPLGGTSTVLSFTLDASSPEAAAAAMRGLRSLRHVVADAAEFPVPAHCAPGDHSRARVGVLHDVEVRMGCPPGLLGSRCQYACRTRWQRFDHRVLPESYDTSHMSARNNHVNEMNRLGSSHVSNRRNTVAELGASVRAVPVRKLLELESADMVVVADAFPDRSAAAINNPADHADLGEHSVHDLDEEQGHFPAHMKHAIRFREQVLATTHFFHGGDHTKQHKMSMITNGCSAGAYTRPLFSST